MVQKHKHISAGTYYCTLGTSKELRGNKCTLPCASEARMCGGLGGYIQSALACLLSCLSNIYYQIILGGFGAESPHLEDGAGMNASGQPNLPYLPCVQFPESSGPFTSGTQLTTPVFGASVDPGGVASSIPLRLFAEGPTWRAVERLSLPPDSS